MVHEAEARATVIFCSENLFFELLDAAMLDGVRIRDDGKVGEKSATDL